jgi:hypothetical protein
MKTKTKDDSIHALILSHRAGHLSVGGDVHYFVHEAALWSVPVRDVPNAGGGFTKDALIWVEAKQANPRKVWVMTFALRDDPMSDGPTVTMHETKAGAEAMLVECVKQSWDDRMGDDAKMPKDPQDMVDAFFDEVSGTYEVVEQSILA